jgi:hypothetical protein
MSKCVAPSIKRRFLELARQLAHEHRQHPHGERQRQHQVGQDQAGKRVVEAEQPDELEHARQHRDLRKHRDRQDGEQQQPPAAERDPPEGIGRRGGEPERDRHHAGGDQDRVEDIAAEGLALEHRDIIRDVEPFGQPGDCEQRAARSQRGDDGIVEGKQGIDADGQHQKPEAHPRQHRLHARSSAVTCRRATMM